MPPSIHITTLPTVASVCINITTLLTVTVASESRAAGSISKSDKRQQSGAGSTQGQEGATPPQTDGLPPQIKLLEVKNPPIEVHVNQPPLFSHVGAVCVLTQPAEVTPLCKHP